MAPYPYPVGGTVHYVNMPVEIDEKTLTQIAGTTEGNYCLLYTSCAIPIITGRHVSRPMEEILDEVKSLVARGVKEFQVIAQELTYYGVDLYKKQMLPELVERISRCV